MNINSPNVALIEGRLEYFKICSWFLKIIKLIEYRIAKKCHDFHHCCRWLNHHYSRDCHVRLHFNETVFFDSGWRLNSKSVISYCFLKEKSLRLGTSYKAKDLFIRSSSLSLLWKASMKCRITQFARESVGLCPFRGSYLREFELSHSNSVNKIIKITHAHNLHVKVLDFILLQFVRTITQIVYYKICSNDFKKSPRLYNICN